MNKYTHWLVRRFFPNVQDFQKPSARIKVAVFEGWLSTILNVILFVIKLVIALAINSIALLADAFHTLADSLSSLVIIFSFKVTGKPADIEHPYGHGRAEYISTLILSMLIVVTGVELIRSSVGRIITPAISHSTPFFIGIILVTVVIKEMMARISHDLGILIDSDTLEADAWHHRSDVFAALLAVVSMILANFGWYNWDGIMGIGVGLFIIWTGFSIGRNAIDSLLGKPPSQQLIERIKSIATGVDGILNIHDIIVHSYGSVRFISLHLEVEEEVSQLEAHEMAETVMVRLGKELRANVNVHMDPVTTSGEKAVTIQNYIEELVKEHSKVNSFHDFRLVQSGDHNMILLELSVGEASSKDDQKRVKEVFRESLKKRFPEFDSRINIISAIHNL